MSIFGYLRYLWFRYETWGELRILSRLVEIERKLDELTPREISPEFAAEMLRSLRAVNTVVKRIATDD